MSPGGSVKTRVSMKVVSTGVSTGVIGRAMIILKLQADYIFMAL